MCNCFLMMDTWWYMMIIFKDWKYNVWYNFISWDFCTVLCMFFFVTVGSGKMTAVTLEEERKACERRVGTFYIVVRVVQVVSVIFYSTKVPSFLAWELPKLHNLDLKLFHLEEIYFVSLGQVFFFGIFLNTHIHFYLHRSCMCKTYIVPQICSQFCSYWYLPWKLAKISALNSLHLA